MNKSLSAEEKQFAKNVADFANEKRSIKDGTSNDTPSTKASNNASKALFDAAKNLRKGG